MSSKTKTFSKNDFDSDSGMMTSVWGPSMWHCLHTMSFNYPINPDKKTREQYYNYILALNHVLPCRYCRENYKNNLKKVKFSRRVFRNRNTFSKFIYNLHEEVNNMLGKQSNLSYDEVRTRYEHFRSRCLKDDKPPKNSMENGCINAFYGKKSKCILQIVPKESKKKTFHMSPKCKIKKLYGGK